MKDENPYTSPANEQHCRQARRVSVVFLPLAIIAGMLCGTLAEWFVTDVEIERSELVAIWALSPITLTVGGGHFPLGREVRFKMALLGLFTFPVIITLSVIFARRRTVAWLLTLTITVAVLYFGVIHKHLAVLSV